MTNKQTDFLSDWENAIGEILQNNENNASAKKKQVDKETIPSHTIQNAQNNENTTTKEKTNNNENTLNLSPTEKKWLKIGGVIFVGLFVLIAIIAPKNKSSIGTNNVSSVRQYNEKVMFDMCVEDGFFNIDYCKVVSKRMVDIFDACERDGTPEWRCKEIVLNTFNLTKMRGY